MSLTRRAAAALLGGLPMLGSGASAAAQAEGAGLKVLDPIRTELVMNLVVTCSAPERPGPDPHAPDGLRDEIWPIVGGRFWGANIRGQVIPGGGDFPFTRPDGVVIVDALYRLKTDDAVQIIIHNEGFAYSETAYRLMPRFTVGAGKYDWLNKSLFLATLIYPPPPEMRLAKGPNENDRLIQVHRVL
ncbi:DUF3237 family protein [Phenylobacterium montanum]|uniref:DUF3237 family protein n=1 Tax=Phenylobacterium montanum TaxID=2823693 RepID=A0A975G4Q8_9CAUL|nr:DUF3237 family protein [Caulobacter sp. S6]QUD90548.1 DUF3237 family protein [Caulobacter sp. S6]